MKYLGVMISNDGSMEKEGEARIGSAVRMIGGMSEAVLRRKELNKKQIESPECYTMRAAHSCIWM